MSDTIGRIEEIIGRRRIRHNEYMDTHTILKTGGPAEMYVETDTLDDLVKIVRAARSIQVPIYIFGGGSAFPVPDKGIAGLVIKNNCRKFEKSSFRGTIRNNAIGFGGVLVSAESGTIMNQLVRFTIAEGLEGLEYQLGLPGSVGGAIYTNAKYKNRYVRDYLHSIKILSIEGEVQTYTKDLPYFVSLEEQIHETQEVVLSVVFKLVPEDKKLLWERGEEALAYRKKTYHG